VLVPRFTPQTSPVADPGQLRRRQFQLGSSKVIDASMPSGPDETAEGTGDRIEPLA
jgi:hypothetical protein